MRHTLITLLTFKRILSFIGNVPFQQLDMKKLEERREKKQAEVDRCTDLRECFMRDIEGWYYFKGRLQKELHAAYEQRKRMLRLLFIRLNWN